MVRVDIDLKAIEVDVLILILIALVIVIIFLLSILVDDYFDIDDLVISFIATCVGFLVLLIITFMILWLNTERGWITFV